MVNFNSLNWSFQSCRFAFSSSFQDLHQTSVQVELIFRVEHKKQKTIFWDCLHRFGKGISLFSKDLFLNTYFFKALTRWALLATTASTSFSSAKANTTGGQDFIIDASDGDDDDRWRWHWYFQDLCLVGLDTPRGAMFWVMCQVWINILLSSQIENLIFFVRILNISRQTLRGRYGSECWVWREISSFESFFCRKKLETSMRLSS